jgi:thiamine-monophosphate kinase
MIDVSDGVASESLHLARNSNVRLDIECANLPVSRALRTYAREHDLDPLGLILNGGEDYELLFVTDTPESRIRKAFASANLGTPVTAIGRVSRGRGIRTFGPDGRPLKPVDSRFEHFG